MNKRLYLISYNFIPSARADGINRGFLCQSLVKNNWDVSVVTTPRPQKLIMTHQEDESLWSILPESVKLHRIQDTKLLGLGEFLYLLRLSVCPHQSWAVAVKNKLQNILIEPGVVYAIIPPISNALIGLEAKRRYGYPLVLDFRDEYLNVEMLHRFSIERSRFKRLESKVLNAADLIIVAVEGIQLSLSERHGLSKQNVHVIYNGYGNIPKDAESARKDQTFKIVYMGTIGRFQKPEVLCHAYQRLIDANPQWQDKIAVEFYGPDNYYVKRYLKKALIPGTSFNGYLPLNRAIEKLNESDVAFISVGHEELYFMLTSKIFYCLNVEKPILASAPEGELKNFIERYRIGLWSHFKDIQGLADNLKELYTNREKLHQFKQNMKSIKNEFSMEVQAGKLSVLMEKLI
jgi:glycosyltransferase involved in cell wall biosynthesis